MRFVRRPYFVTGSRVSGIANPVIESAMGDRPMDWGSNEMNRMAWRRFMAQCARSMTAVLLVVIANAEDRPQWGEAFTRNMVSSETGLPNTFDPETGANVKWSAPLGGNAYGSPVIANGCVLIGANNQAPRDPRVDYDCGVLLCLNESDGALRWQLAVPRTGGDDYLDWPMIGMCSEPTVEGDRVYTVTNRYEVVCLDLKGQANGNDGPYADEGQHMAQDGKPALEVTATDADIVWLANLREAVDMYPHDGAHMAILLDGDYLYLNTGNGVDNTHKVVRKPDAPTLVVLDKNTGKVLAKDNEGMGHRIMHAAWSSPSLGTVNGKKLIAFGGPDGVCYAFEALPADAPRDTVQTLTLAWKFDCDPNSPKENRAEYLNNRKESPSVIEGMPVFIGERVYVTAGGDPWWGKEQSWLKCIDATKAGDITATGQVWSYEMPAHCVATPAVTNGLVFVADCKGIVHCVDAATGQANWTHDIGGECWGSAFVADGKVYVGSRNKQFWTFAASKDKKELASVKLSAPVSATPVAANGVLYVATLDTLYAAK